MSYPQNIDEFIQKLNKRDEGYVIEEDITIVDGVFEGLLAHDNIKDSSINVYTGSQYTGEKIDSFIISIPSETPWKRIIKIFTSNPKVYVIYETTGDQVEAEDINRLQDSIVATQIELDKYKEDLSSHTSGDMMKSIYDTTDNGKVDYADKVDWSGVLNKPTEFPPSVHNHDEEYLSRGALTWNNLKGVE
ncbi:hypothetical protein [Wukongibacter sp. M2B1]|uniref:hypothetical protein n=1 Tax=Wukongibacter sp. M2B1 TaxID=3088895 RepID=UPI003D7C0ECC